MPAHTKYIDFQNGHDLAGHGSAALPWQTIDYAINTSDFSATLIDGDSVTFNITSTTVRTGQAIYPQINTHKTLTMTFQLDPSSTLAKWYATDSGGVFAEFVDIVGWTVNIYNLDYYSATHHFGYRDTSTPYRYK